MEAEPAWILVAERRDFPPAEAKSIAHVFQNMWLKPTELAIGFMLLSLTGMLSAHKAFMAELGLTRVEFNGWLVGTPVKASEPSIFLQPQSLG